MDNAECPICLVKFSPLSNGAEEALHPGTSDCQLSNYLWPIERWNMRPPKKGQPAVTSELEYLRSLVDRLLKLQEPYLGSIEDMDVEGK